MKLQPLLYYMIIMELQVLESFSLQKIFNYKLFYYINFERKNKGIFLNNKIRFFLQLLREIKDKVEQQQEKKGLMKKTLYIVHEKQNPQRY